MRSKETNDRKKQAKILRYTRKTHRIAGLVLVIFFLLVAITSILLGWKKNSNGYLIPETQQGTSSNLAEWRSLHDLNTIALQVFKDSLPAFSSPEVDRMDVRRSKGVIKVTFKNTYQEVQLDGATGEMLHFGKRRSDFIENLHDGSILDIYFNTSHEQFKFVYSTIMGLGLLLFSVTGFWLWYGPKKMKKKPGTGRERNRGRRSINISHETIKRPRNAG